MCSAAYLVSLMVAFYFCLLEMSKEDITSGGWTGHIGKVLSPASVLSFIPEMRDDMVHYSGC